MKRIKGYQPEPDGDTDVTQRIDLAHAIAKLTPRQQAIIALRTEGYTQQAITGLLAVSRTTVWVDEKEAYRQLAYVLGPQPIEEYEETA